MVKRPQRRPGEGAGQLADAFRTLAAKSDYVTPERAAQLDDLERRQRERAREAAVKALRGQSGLQRTIYASASLRSLSYPHERLTPAEFRRYADVVEDLARLLTEPEMIVLSGANGPGKTYLAAATVNAFCDACRPALFCTAVHYYRMLASTFGEPGRTQLDFYNRMHRLALLVVDEIEKKPDSEWKQTEFFDLVNARYSAGAATILITNKTPEQLNGTATLPAFLDTGIRDRIRHKGAIIHCDWPSLRGPSRGDAGGKH